MEKFKFPEVDIRFTKEIKNIRIKSKDVEPIHFSKSPTIGKSKPIKEILPIKNIKKSTPKIEQLNSTKNTVDIKPKENEKQIQQAKNETGNIIKEKVISNIPNKGKGSALEKVPLKNKNKNNKNVDINKKKDNIKSVMEIGKKHKYPKRHNNIGKNNQNNSNRNKGNRININETMKQIQIKKKNKNRNDVNEYNNVDNVKNININKEKQNHNQNNNNYYLIYIINKVH